VITNVFAAEMAAQHHQKLIREAAQYRRTKAARLGAGRKTMFERATDGIRLRVVKLGGVRIRPLRPTDAQMLSEGFAHLSPESRRMRFLYNKTELGEAELRFLTDIDHDDHEALIAVNRIGGRGLGVARYIRLTADPTTADVAVTVMDAAQGSGIGTRLVRALTARACAEGVSQFSALMASDNIRARRLLAAVGGPVRLVSREAGTAQYEVALTPAVQAPARRATGVPSQSIVAACVGGRA
jgi:RimJ/RimL family protein N-acetyltransferase